MKKRITINFVPILSQFCPNFEYRSTTNHFLSKSFTNLKNVAFYRIFQYSKILLHILQIYL